MKNYYSILEVEEDASQPQIKKAYRSLVKKYHPDRSSIPHAEKLFAEVNEAYKVLSDPEQRVIYDQKKSGNHTRSRYASSYRYSAGQKVDLKPYIVYFRAISSFGLVISIVLSLDFLLPRTMVSDRVINVENIIASTKSGQQILVAKKIFTDYEVYEISEDLSMRLYKNQPIGINKSKILSLTTSIDFKPDNAEHRYYLNASIYRNFSFGWIVLLITSVIGVALKKSPEMILNFGIVNGILILLVIFFTLIS